MGAGDERGGNVVDLKAKLDFKPSEYLNTVEDFVRLTREAVHSYALDWPCGFLSNAASIITGLEGWAEMIEQWERAQAPVADGPTGDDDDGPGPMVAG